MPRSSRLSFELLETFVRLVDNEGKASVTAEYLGINQASMSKRLAQLHNSGVLVRRPWLTRVGKRWRLTAEGRKMLPAARDLVLRYERMSDALETAEPGPQPVTFACGQNAATGYVCEAVAQILHQHPDVRIRVSTLRSRARIEGVVNGALDLALVSHRPEAIERVAGRPLFVEPIFEDPLVLAVSRAAKTPWARRIAELPQTRVSPQQLTELPLIVPEPEADSRRRLERVFRAAGVRERIDIALEIGGWPAVLAYVRRGIGAAIVPRSALSGSADRFRILELDVRKFEPLVSNLICLRQAGPSPQPALSPSAALFAGFLRTAAAEANSGI